MNIIIFENTDNTVGVIHPTTEGLTRYAIEQIAIKDTPTGLPFWVRYASDIPSDREFRDAWCINPAWGDPDGYGN